MNLSKAQRAALKQKFGGRCAYCGEPLGDKWHGDHVIAVKRGGHWERRKSDVFPYYTMVYVQDGTMRKPEHDSLENMYPACIPCNMSKGDQNLEHWRKKLQEGAMAARRDCPIYKHAVRFGLIVEIPRRVEFWFERYTPRKRFTIKD